MSGPLLLGIAAVGVGWAWLHRDSNTVASTVATTAAAGAVTGGATAADTQTVPTQITPGTSAVTCAVDASSPTPGITNGDNTLPVTTSGEMKQIAPDPTASSGGADPATQPSSFWAGTSSIENGGKPPATTADTERSIMEARYGDGGSNGMTDAQISNAYRDSAVWSGEVF